jgi:hypothetical protein
LPREEAGTVATMVWFRRAVVLLLVALALPLQAVAAAAMLHCQPAAGGHAAVHGADRADPAAGLAGQGAHASDHGHADGHAHTAPPGDADAGPGSAHACSACATCCTLAGVPVMVLGVPAPEPTPAARGDAPPPAAMFLTSGVERPPRG